MGKENSKNAEVEVVHISSDFDVFPCFPSLDSPALDDLLTDIECTCLPCGPQRFVSQIEKSLRYESSIQITPKEGKDMLQQQNP